jgi:hypothetical protein
MMPRQLENTMRLTSNTPGLLAYGPAVAIMACLPSAVLADVGCPMKVEVKQALTAPPSGWTAGLDKLPAEAAGVSVFDGPPEELADLVPDDSKDGADTRSDIWNLPHSDRGYWLVCHYANTTVTLARPLPATVTRCEAVYEKQQTFAGGAPVMRSSKCGPGGP